MSVAMKRLNESQMSSLEGGLKCKLAAAGSVAAAASGNVPTAVLIAATAYYGGCNDVEGVMI